MKLKMVDLSTEIQRVICKNYKCTEKTKTIVYWRIQDKIFDYKEEIIFYILVELRWT